MSKKSACCGHLAARHLKFEDGTHICLTGDCRCGRTGRQAKRSARPDIAGKTKSRYKQSPRMSTAYGRRGRPSGPSFTAADPVAALAAAIVSDVDAEIMADLE